MEKNCKTCGYCKFEETKPSPGGVMLITNYKCKNRESGSYDRTMNSVTAHGKTLDSRENNTCDQWTDKSEVPADTITMEVPVGIGKTGHRKVTISDVDDSSTINIKGVKNSVVKISQTTLIVNDKKVFIPSHVRIARPNCFLHDNDKIYINGFKYNEKTGTFQRTLLSWLKCVFS